MIYHTNEWIIATYWEQGETVTMARGQMAVNVGAGFLVNHLSIDIILSLQYVLLQRATRVAKTYIVLLTNWWIENIPYVSHERRKL